MDDLEMLQQELEGLREYRTELRSRVDEYRATITARIEEQTKEMVVLLQKDAPKENALPKWEESVQWVREQSAASQEVLITLRGRLANTASDSDERDELERKIRAAELDKAKADNAVSIWEARYEKGQREVDQLRVLLPARFKADWSWRDGYMEGPHWVLLHHWQGWLEEWAGQPEAAALICEVMTVLSDIFALWAEVYRQDEP